MLHSCTCPARIMTTRHRFSFLAGSGGGSWALSPAQWWQFKNTGSVTITFLLITTLVANHMLYVSPRLFGQVWCRLHAVVIGVLAILIYGNWFLFRRHSRLNDLDSYPELGQLVAEEVLGAKRKNRNVGVDDLQDTPGYGLPRSLDRENVSVVFPTAEGPSVEDDCQLIDELDDSADRPSAKCQNSSSEGDFQFVNYDLLASGLDSITTSVSGGGQERKSFPAGQIGDRVRYCDLCSQYNVYRSHHCPICNRCVVKRDHHCFFLGRCIGLGNQRYFLVFGFWAAIGAGYALACLSYYLITIGAPEIFQPVLPFGWLNFVPPVIPIRAAVWGGISGAVLALSCLFYVGWFGMVAPAAFFMAQTYFVITGRTMFENAKNMAVPDRMTIGQRLEAVFGSYWALNFVFPLPFPVKLFPRSLLLHTPAQVVDKKTGGPRNIWKNSGIVMGGGSDLKNLNSPAAEFSNEDLDDDFEFLPTPVEEKQLAYFDSDQKF